MTDPRPQTLSVCIGKVKLALSTVLMGGGTVEG